ncbi:phosphoglucosamine mutase, partial [Candidatus Micrarchaeota archaeon]|nr:phosphoglucosamine mutase [Candidatus Micrarchaeota archaeon]
INLIDGIREDFDDGFILIRASGTEHIIRLTAEFKTEKRLEEIKEKAEKIIRWAVQ